MALRTLHNHCSRTSNLTYSLLTNTHFRSLMFREMHRSGDQLSERWRSRQTDTWLTTKAETADANFASSYRLSNNTNRIAGLQHRSRRVDFCWTEVLFCQYRTSSAPSPQLRVNVWIVHRNREPRSLHRTKN